MRIVGFDTETALFQPGLKAPPLACVSFAEHVGDEVQGWVKDRVEGLREVAALIRDPGVILVGQNVAYDFGVLCAADPSLIRPVFEAYSANRVRDTKLREKLLAIRDGTLDYEEDDEAESGWSKPEFSLDAMAKKYLDMALDKSTWRLRYGTLIGVPFAEWPAGAVEYPRRDGEATLGVYYAQQHRTNHYEYSTEKLTAVVDEPHQCRTAWALQLMAIWGIRTDLLAVKKVEAEYEKDLAGIDAELKKITRIISVSKTRTKNKQTYKVVEQKEMSLVKRDGGLSKAVEQQLVIEAYTRLGRAVPYTEPSKKFPAGQVSTKGEVLKDVNDADLERLAERSHVTKMLTAFIPAVKLGARVPITADWNVPVGSGRTSCARPPLQQPPRKGGIRECFVPRLGFVFCSVDYDTAELRSLAQHCLDTLGYSRLADAFKEGRDPHVEMAADILGITKEEAYRRKKLGEADHEFKEARQLAKAANFGFPGGLGPDKFIRYAKTNYGVIITRERAVELKEIWLANWPETREFFEQINAIVGPMGDGVITTRRSGRQRGGLGFCDACNTNFQPVTADGATDALFWVSYESYCVETSPLYGSRPVLFLHDEIVTEMPTWRAHEAAYRQNEIMQERMALVVPDIPVTCEPALMERWYKGAETVKVDGRLVPWRPKPRELTEVREAA